jgi:glutathione S-transferase
MAPPLPSLRLYRIDGACSLAAHMALHELQIPFTSTRMVLNPLTEMAEAADGSLTGDDYVREIHPNGQVPALEVQLPGSSSSDGGAEEAAPVVITENPAILMYIADLASTLNPAVKLAGATDLETWSAPRSQAGCRSCRVPSTDRRTGHCTGRGGTLTGNGFRRRRRR